MNPFLIAALAVGWLAILVCCWFGWQLLRQNGRILLRLEEFEKRFDELEFGEPGDELPDESQGEARHSVRAETEAGNSGALETDAPYAEDRASRFNNRSLARSKIKRDGL